MLGYYGVERVAQTRTLELLELVNTPEARKHLQALADGNPGACLTIDARAALNRLSRRP
jgi:hypothetical protein